MNDTVETANEERACPDVDTAGLSCRARAAALWCDSCCDNETHDTVVAMMPAQLRALAALDALDGLEDWT